MSRKISQTALFVILSALVFSCSDDSNKTEAVKSITLNVTSLEMEKGTSDTIYARIEPLNADNKRVIWKSDNSTIAWIGADNDEECVVRANSIGTATISATTMDGGLIASCLINVYENIESMYLSSECITLEKGETKRLTCRFFPVDATYAQAKWTSSNTNIATVDADGNVTAIHGGEAVISATSADDKFSKSCLVNVTVTLKGISLDKKTLSMIEGEESQLVAKLVPEDTTTPDYYWNSSDPSIATIDESGKLTALKAGKVTISVTTRVGNFSDNCLVDIEPSEVIDFKPYGDEQNW